MAPAVPPERPPPHADRPGSTAVEQAALVLRAGGLVAFPTETVYGLGADASSTAAIERLYRVKGRPRGHPVIVHVATARHLDTVAASVGPVARALAEELWPGPLTLVVVRHPGVVVDAVTGGRATVGVRVPDHPVATALLHAFGGGVAAPSANRFGRVSPTTAEHVRAELGADVDVVLDGGACTIGVESTVVDVTGPEPRVLRIGAVPLEGLAAVVGRVPEVADRGEVAAPGTLAAHYAPEARVIVGAPAELAARVAARLPGARVAIVGLEADLAAEPALDAARATVRLAAPDVETYARELYATLRAADAAGVTEVFAVPPPAAGLGAAVADRLERAAAASPHRR